MSATHPCSTHLYHLHQPTRHWATLQLKSGAKRSEDVPCFTEGEDVSGFLDVPLANLETCSNVSLSIVGRIDSALSGRRIFYDESINLLSSSATGSRTYPPGSFIPPGNSASPQCLSLAFKFSLPLSGNFADKNADLITFPLPPSFEENNARFAVRYELVVCISRAWAIRDTSRSTFPIAYDVLRRPGRLSDLGTLAEEGQIPLHGPYLDPDGWHSLEPVALQGKLFQHRAVTVLQHLSFAKPLVYTRGTKIPVILRLECTDTQALDLLSQPSAPILHLYRHARDPDRLPEDPIHLDSRLVASATWRPFSEPGEPPEHPHHRTLTGVIALPEDIVGSAVFGPFRLSYVVVLYPSRPTGFEPNQGHRMQVTRVDITTHKRLGELMPPPRYE